jgi:hypothetical protein
MRMTMLRLIQATVQPVMNLDAAESVFLSKQLEQVRAKTYDIKYANLLGRQLVPVDNSIAPGVEVVTYYQYDQVGVAKIIADYADDLPRADVKGKEFSSRVRGIGNSYGYSMQEARAAQFAGLPLEQRKANAARRGIEEKIDKIAQTGDAVYGMLGFLNQPNASLYTIPNGVSGFPDWARKLPDEIAADIHGAVNAIYANTKGVEMGDTCVLPLEQYTLIATKRMGDGSDTTILSYVLQSSPFLKAIVPWYALDGAGAGNTDRMVVYRRDPDALQLIIPQEFEQLPPQLEGLEIITPCHARCGGVVVYYPLSIIYADGI